MISRIYFGVDISKRWFDVCALVGSKESCSRYDNTPDGFDRFLKAVPEDAKKAFVCMEYTGGYETALALACKEAGYIVSLVDGAKIAYFRRSFGSSVSTTDKGSSRLLALFCKQRKPAQWFPVPDEYRTLRELVRHRESLMESRTAWSSRSAYIVENELATAQKRTLCELLALQTEEAEKAIASHISAHQNLKEANQLLTSIPGVAAKSAARILAETGPIDNYISARAYALSAGLVPIVVHSGLKTPPGKLPIYGNRDLRCALFYPTIVDKKNKKGVGRFMARLDEKGNKVKMTVVAAGMRKLAHVVYGVLKHRRPFDPEKMT